MGSAERIARHTWWVPWLIAAAVVPVAAGTVLRALGADRPLTRASFELPRSAHQVVYEVTGAGTAPEIRYVTDGVNRTKTLRDTGLPWRAELDIEVGPALGVVQVVAAGDGPITCTVAVDGVVVHTAAAVGGWTSCSTVIRP